MNRKILRTIGVGVVISLLLGGIAGAQDGAPQITAEPVPGLLEVMQGTAVKLGSDPPPEGPRPESYLWEIVQGVGGALYDEHQAEAIFRAPEITEDLELFAIRLTVIYEGQQPAHATVHIRVHRQMPAGSTKAEREKSIEEVMTGYYRRESDAREANRQRVEANQPRVVDQTVYSGFYGGVGYGRPGWGWGYGWGWPATYPIFAPIVVPPPGVDWGPGDGDWGQPIAIPYDDLATTFPESIADDYLPQDFPGAAQPSDMGAAGGTPTDFIVFPSGTVRDPDGDDLEPGFYIDELDFSEPEIDP